MAVTPSASYSLTVRVEIRNRPGMLGRVTSAIGDAGGDIGAVDIVELLRDRIVRDFTIAARDERHGHEIVTAVRQLEGVRVVDVSDRTFLMHLGGKIRFQNKVPVKTRDDLSMAYTPGVARVRLAIKEDRQKVFALTIKQNAVAVVTDGTAVLGLGLLDCRASRVTDEMKIAATQAIASIVGRNELDAGYVIPSVFNKKVAPAVARQVIKAAHKAGVARRRKPPAHH